MKRKGNPVEFILCLIAGAVIVASIVWGIGTAYQREEDMRTARLDAQISPEQRAEVMKGVER